MLDPLIIKVVAAIVLAVALIVFILVLKRPKPPKVETWYISCYAESFPAIRTIVVSKDKPYGNSILEVVTLGKVEERVKFWKRLYNCQ